MRIHTHKSHKKSAVLAMGGIITIVATGMFVFPQVSNALSLSTLLNYDYGQNTTLNNTSKATTTGKKTAVTPTVKTVLPTQTVTTPSTTASTSAPAASTSNSNTSTSTPVASSTSSSTNNTKVTPTVSEAVATVSSVDTATQAKVTANAQALGASSKIVYKSNKMDPSIAMNIYKAAGVTTLIAILMLASTSLKLKPATPLAQRQNILSN